MIASAELRVAYLRWVRRATPVLLLPLLLTALMQSLAAAEWWGSGPAAAAGVRYLFLSVAVAAVVVGRNVRTRDTAAGALEPLALVSLSWRLLTYALAPVAIGVPLAFMTQQSWDFYAMLVVTLVGLWLLFPRYDQWLVWSAPVASKDADTEADGRTAGPVAPGEGERQ